MRRSGSGGSYPGHTRARDADRATTRELLDRARADGQLSEDEHDALTELAVVEIHVKGKDGSSGYLTTTFAGEPLAVFPPSR
ncbi:DUF1707 domain-containing protein [Nocardia sp. NPDC004260]